MEEIDKVELALEAPPDLPPPLPEKIVRAQLEAERAEAVEAEKVTIERVEQSLLSEPALDTEQAREHLHEVMAEAEDGQPTEGQRERSHEAKDFSLASSVGQVLSQIHQQTQAAYASFHDNRASAPLSGVTDSAASVAAKLPVVRNLPGLYQRALLGGLAGGLIVIVVLVLMQL